MGKKGKKKKSQKKEPEPEITWNEALLAYKIGIQEKQFEDIKYQLRALEDKHRRHLERNERLRSEQRLHVAELLGQAKMLHRHAALEPMTSRDEVVTAMKANWATQRREENGVAKLKEDLAHQQAVIAVNEQDVVYWREYRDGGSDDHVTVIALLEAELSDMQHGHSEMAAHLESTWTKTRAEIQLETNVSLDDQKYLASQRAMNRMDKYSKREVLDNDWLKREAAIHSTEVDKLMVSVSSLEKENLEMLAELFECSVDDLKISRNFFLTQFTDEDNLENSGILEMDLEKVSYETHQASGTSLARPMSAVEKAIVQKVQSLPTAKRLEHASSDSDESDFDGGREKQGYDSGAFENYFTFDDEHFGDYLQLGPLELKLLSLTGKQMTIERPTPLSADEAAALDFRPESWPVTNSMLDQYRQHRAK